MRILFSQDWDILPEKEDEYDEFIAEFIRECEKLGIQAVGGFYIEVGFGPRIVFVGSAESLEKLGGIISGKAYKDILLELKKYVVNYGTRVLEPTGRVKHEAYEIQKGVWKYNQYYDLIPGKKEEYADFIINEHLPAMEKIDYVEVTGGWNVIMGGFCEIIAEFTFKSPVDIGRILDNEDFRRITDKLRRDYVINYRTRVMRTTERFDEPKWYRL